MRYTEQSSVVQFKSHDFASRDQLCWQIC